MVKSIESTDRMTVGLDLGDRRCHFVVLSSGGEVVEEGRLATRPGTLRARFAALGEAARVVLEVGTHSAWASRLLAELGHEVVVANPRQVALVYGSPDKSDPVDAESLARLGRLDVNLLRPVVPRCEETLVHRGVLRAREALVRCRTLLVNHVRSAVKVQGGRLPGCSTAAFAKRVRGVVPEAVRESLEPLLAQIEALGEAIRGYDRKLEALAQTRYLQTERLRQVAGVGVQTALAFVLAIEDPARFRSSRAVGSFVGLRPRRCQSGSRDPQLRITKGGDGMTRRLLIAAAHYILGPFGPDTDLRRFGERLAARGGQAAKKRAVVAVARKLAVLLHRLWVTGDVYEPLRPIRANGVSAKA